MPRPNIDEIRKRVQAVDRPWIVEKGKKFSGKNWLMAACGTCYDGDDCWVTTDNVRGSESRDPTTEEIAAFIAHAPSDVPALLDYVAELESELRMYRKAATELADEGRLPIYLSQRIAEDAIPIGKEGSKSDE